jgi:hypothetical protein
MHGECNVKNYFNFNRESSEILKQKFADELDIRLAVCDIISGTTFRGIEYIIKI